jgi:putative membrane protein
MYLLAIAITSQGEFQMQQRKQLNRMLGIAALAMLFGGSSVHAQSTGTTSATGSGTTAAQSSSGTSANSSAGASKGSNGSVSKGDQRMMKNLAEANFAEIDTGKLALQKSQSDQVKTFAQKMIDDHTQAQKELEQLAQQKGVTLPTETDMKHKAAAKALSALEGEKFDKMYMNQVGVMDHKNTHRLLTKAQKDAKDPDLKALAAKLTPTVDGHLSMAQDQTGKKGSSSGSSGKTSSNSASGSSSSGSK